MLRICIDLTFLSQTLPAPDNHYLNVSLQCSPEWCFFLVKTFQGRKASFFIIPFFFPFFFLFHFLFHKWPAFVLWRKKYCCLYYEGMGSRIQGSPVGKQWNRGILAFLQGAFSFLLFFLCLLRDINWIQLLIHISVLRWGSFMTFPSLFPVNHYSSFIVKGWGQNSISDFNQWG